MQILTIDYKSAEAPAQFSQSLKETGFAVLVNHPIPRELIAQSYQQWKDFFYSEQKKEYLFQSPAQDGYFPFRTETAKNHKISDLKEFYHFYPHGKKPAATEEISAKMFADLQKLASQLLQWIEDFLPEKVAGELSMPLRNMIKDSGNTLLRILHYPPLVGDFEKNAVRAAPHEDINLLTLLPAATTPGLEVLDVKGNWHSVTCDPGNIVVNVGDMLQMCTQYYYKSTTHRVTNPADPAENSSRFSMPFFLHAKEDVLVSENLTAGEYLHNRLCEIGIRN
jgi:isopenicillin N synthase-like dioxygenase